MNPASIPRDIILNGTIRYGVSRRVPAENSAGKKVQIALVVIERDSGAFQTLAIQEDLIKFAGEDIIRNEVERAVGLC